MVISGNDGDDVAASLETSVAEASVEAPVWGFDSVAGAEEPLQAVRLSDKTKTKNIKLFFMLPLFMVIESIPTCPKCIHAGMQLGISQRYK